jgi:hypothetical protein
MAARKAFLLRLDPRTYEALERWAKDELRSVNGQIEFLLRSALQKAGRGKTEDRSQESERADGRADSDS